MTFSIIGTGNIAWFFGNRLMTARHHCKGVYARNSEAARILSEALLADCYGEIETIEDGDADVCILAVSDTAIVKVAAGLSFNQTMLLHSAGSVGLDTITTAKDRAVLWPVYSILKNNMPDHRNIPCAWEASSEKAKRCVLTMGHAISDVLFEAKYEQRKWLHLSAVIGNNFTNHLLAICNQICVENDLPFSAVMPIIEQTFDRVRTSSPNLLQTGPAIRHDSSTIARQVAMLEKYPRWQKIYEAITDSIQGNSAI